MNKLPQTRAGPINAQCPVLIVDYGSSRANAGRVNAGDLAGRSSSRESLFDRIRDISTMSRLRHVTQARIFNSCVTHTKEIL